MTLLVYLYFDNLLNLLSTSCRAAKQVKFYFDNHTCILHYNVIIIIIVIIVCYNIIINTIINITGGETNTVEALNAVDTEVFRAARGDRNGVQNVAVVISDGNSNLGQENTISTAEALKAQGVTVVAVAAGESIHMDEVNAIASTPNSLNVYKVLNDTETDIINTANQLLDYLCVGS